MMRILFAIFSFILLVYLLIPGPGSIQDFPQLPNSVKSTLEGDTIQVPNVAGYFSNHYRDFATNYFYRSFQEKILLPLPLIKLNYPPEFAYTAIKDQTESTYLEEYVSPFRSSLFINGYEQYYEDGQPKFWRSARYEIGDGQYETKVTLRYYQSALTTRLILWLGIVVSLFYIWKIGRRVLFNG